MKNQTFLVMQTQPDGTVECLYETWDEDAAENEVYRINSRLSDAGVPSAVSCAYVA